MSVRTENYVNDGYQYGIVRDLAKGGTEVFYPAQNTLASAYSEYRSYRYHDKCHYEGRGNVRIERRPVGQWEPVPAEELAAQQKREDEDRAASHLRPWIEEMTA